MDIFSRVDFPTLQCFRRSKKFLHWADIAVSRIYTFFVFSVCLRSSHFPAESGTFVTFVFMKSSINMSDRKLRNQPRKNYSKMASGVDGDIESEGERENNNKLNEGEFSMDGEIIGREVLLSPVSSNGDSSNVDSESDDDVAEARKQLREVKNEIKQLSQKTKKSKLQRIEQEKEQLQKSLEKLKLKKDRRKKQDGGQVTTESLRSMQGVVDRVDRMMDKNLRLDKGVASSSNSSDSSSESDDTSASSNSTDAEKKKSKRKGKKKSKKSGKHRSGKSKRLTSYVKFPQKWPHSQLSLHFVSREKKYEDLSLAEFCAGYTTILEMSSEQKKGHRLAHFKELMYLATRYQWRCVLNYHAACLLEIERGNMRWGDNFQVLQNTTLAGGFLNMQKSNRSSGASGANGNSSKEGGTVFCRGYQRGTCTHSQDHQGYFNNASRLLGHICAKCWLKNKDIAANPKILMNVP